MSATKDSKPDYSINNSDVVEKYRTAGVIAQKALAHVKTLVVDGAKIWDICQAGDELIEEEISKIYNSKKNKVESKGIAFPTSISPNNIADHLSPISADDEAANLTLKAGDVAKIHLGAQIDGFPSIVSETVVVGASKAAPVTGATADLLTAAYKASEAALRTIKPGNKNYDVTKVVAQVAKEYGVTPLEGMLSHNQERGVLTGEKEIIINPNEEQRAQVAPFEFEVGQVFGLDILVSSGEGKVKPAAIRTSIYKLTGNTYQLKLKSSHLVFNEIKRKASKFPFAIKNLDDPTKGKTGLKENCSHGTMIAYDIYQEKEGQQIAQVYVTVAITKNGLVKFTSAEFDNEIVKSEKEVSPELKELLAKSLKVKKAKKEDK
ncbi:CYFA0S01e17238g1_1 [Cyberlindnera fabianii]|uniref:CYFA0S01e17238g1_1 n=1 Tax=Cyberlindnera fabianii TaxID=36022 RepID=A0A061AST7_CYBFA|nr:Curved DNA-binding protein [Cyberlindnera fabianii]CDR37789.1 CYFA0S01e17238g1_1 [Cyberlindnera fabianii]